MLTTACPRLGFKNDPASHATQPSAHHGCWAAPQVPGIPLDHQAEFCFSGQYTACPLYSDVQAARPATPRVTGLRRWLAAHVFYVSVGLIVLLAFAAAAIYIALTGGIVPSTNAPALAPARQNALATASPGISAPAVTRPVATATSTVAARATPASTAVPAASTTGTGTPGPSQPGVERLYTVQPGDGLSSIAEQFQVTVTALAAANGLSTTASLDLGQILRIPAPATPVR